MDIKLSTILKMEIKNIKLIREGEFNALALINGKLAKDTKLLVYINTPEYISLIGKNENIKCIICTKEIYETIIIKMNEAVLKMGIVISDNPRTSFFLFHNYLNENTKFYVNDFENKIDVTAQIHDTCIIPDKNIIIGKNVILRPYVVLYENTVIEDNVVIGDGSVIGHPAFYYFEFAGIRVGVESVGGVSIKEHVDIHSHVVICKGVLGGITDVGRNSKVDSHVFIGHDVRIKENGLIPAGSVFAGSVTVNENCFIGIGSRVVPQIDIGKNSMISAGSTVVKNVKDGAHVSGNFAMDHVKYVNFLRKISQGKI